MIAAIGVLSCVLIGAMCASPHYAYAAGSYKIVYNLNGGVQPDDQITKVRKGKTIKISKIKSPTKKGYVFKGWYTDKKLTKKAKSVKGKSNKAKRTLYAKWKAKKYVIAYKLSGGTFVGSHPSSYTYGKGLKLPKLERPGYTFVGWYSDKAKTKAVKKIAKTATGKKTLYAKWKKNTYTIAYHVSGGVLSGSYKTSYTVTSNITLPIPTRLGYVFLGWYDDQSMTNALDSIVAGTVGNKDLYARWMKRILVAHRGFHEEAAQNSLDSFIQAADSGFTHVEADVRFTKDGVPVLSHDATIRVYAGEEYLDVGGSDSSGNTNDGLNGLSDAALVRQVDDRYDEFISETGEIAGSIADDLDDGWSGEAESGCDPTDETLIAQTEESTIEAWAIEDHTYAEIQQAKLASTPSGPDGSNITTYAELLDACVRYGLHPTIDLKAGNSYQIYYLMDLAERYGVFDDARWGASNFTVLKYVQAYNAQSLMCYYSNALSEAEVKKAKKLADAGANIMVSSHYANVSDSVVELCRGAHLALGAYGVKDEIAAAGMNGYVGSFTIDSLFADKVPATI